jgi:formate dehydrogenase (NADP+) alpha subunit
MSTERLHRADAERIELEIDHVRVAVPRGVSVLRAAELAGAEVPSLCSHKELSAFGGCRLCTVEIDGMRGYPLACSTEARPGMQVTTDTVALREMREEVLQLILSQHPASCLFCGEQDECRRNQTTIRKAGVSTGCRSCPNDGACELQKVVEQVGLTELKYPIAYRGLEPEHDDPFYDRDYNLCILCGRCVRMCHEVRGASVLAFKYRGPKTVIGPAFGVSHSDAGCEFCGACVSVCPTGALADKVSKWDREADAISTSTCPFCGFGCQLELGSIDGRLSWARGGHDEQLNDGQLCVRGRFCLPETTHHFDRARKPMLRQGRYNQISDWDEALSEVSAMLSYAAADDFLMLVSADLTNESLYAAQRFARTAVGSNGLDSSDGARLPGGTASWSRLFGLPISFDQLGQAEAVIVAGLDSRFSFSVVGVQVRRAVRRGGSLVVVDARESNLVPLAGEWLPAAPGAEARELVHLLRAILGEESVAEGRRTGEARRLAAAAGRLAAAKTLAVVVGPRVFDSLGAGALLSELETVAGRAGVTVLPLREGANLRGALELGAMAGVLPGPRPATGDGLTLPRMASGARPSVIYLVGEAPFTTRPDCDFLIAQDLYVPPFEVDAFLPAASFAEADGTLTNLEGRVQELRGVEAGADGADPWPDWRIFAELARRLDRPGLEFDDAVGVRAAIREELPGYPGEGDRGPRRMTALDGARPPAAAGAGERHRGRGCFLLVPEPSTFRHRGIDLGGVVEGLGELRPEHGLRMNADDLAGLGVKPGEVVTIETGGARIAVPARADPGCPRGAVYATQVQAWGGRADGDASPAFELLSRLPATPVKVTVTAGEPAAGPVGTGERAAAGERATRRKKAGGRETTPDPTRGGARAAHR